MADHGLFVTSTNPVTCGAPEAGPDGPVSVGPHSAAAAALSASSGIGLRGTVAAESAVAFRTLAVARRSALGGSRHPHHGLQMVPDLQQLVAVEAELEEPEDDGDEGDAQEDVEEAREGGPVQLLGSAGPVRARARVRAGPPPLTPLVHQPRFLHLHDAAEEGREERSLCLQRAVCDLVDQRKGGKIIMSAACCV